MEKQSKNEFEEVTTKWLLKALREPSSAPPPPHLFLDSLSLVQMNTKAKIKLYKIYS